MGKALTFTTRKPLLVAELPHRVLREHPFEDELSALRVGGPREADDFVEAAEFSLARDPELGLQISPGSLYL